MSQRLPVRIDPVRLARQGRSLAGEIELSGMARLGQNLCAQPGNARVEMDFALGADGVVYIRGRVRAQLDLTCQRCMEPMQVTVAPEFVLGVVRSEAEAERLPDEYEPLILSDDQLFVADVIEDELILALPIVARHPLEDCPAREQLEKASHAEAGAEESEARENPFAVLNDLKTKH